MAVYEYESEVVRVYDAGTHYIMEILPLLGRPVINKQAIDLLDDGIIVAEVVMLEDGKVGVARWHFPKSLKDVVLQRAESITQKFRRGGYE